MLLMPRISSVSFVEDAFRPRKYREPYLEGSEIHVFKNIGKTKKGTGDQSVDETFCRLMAKDEER